MSAPDLDRLEGLARAVVWRRYRNDGPFICDEDAYDQLVHELGHMISETDADRGSATTTVALWLLLEIKALRDVEDEARKLTATSDSAEVGYLRGALLQLDRSRRERGREGT